ncbi:polyketide synthase [Colletotrichum nymphaeae SA-01]|uniref:Polyketide synthase n=1 Tax=Colletotrichum nymphaeae SA-01 TaxID=1460502 RepID=A0A135U9I1_9PEZI|nr:polyketide synthase [Colletotrichum nymphaeae SA-01]
MREQPAGAPSAAFFCPVPFLVDKTYLEALRRRIIGSPFLKPLADAIRETPAIWELLANDKRAQHVASGDRGAEFARAFTKWITEGETGVIASQPSTIVSFPLLLLTGLCQWCSYLDLSGQTQADVLAALGAGGIQGYCGGMLSTIAVASSAREEELGQRAGNFYRTAFLMGVFMSEGETGPPENAPDMLIVRLKHQGQDKELIEQFPGIYASATTNPVTICFAGRKSELAPLKEYVAANHMFSIQTYPTGTGHDPRNAQFLDGMLAIVAENESFHLPGAEALLVPVQSNWDGELLLKETPTELAKNVLGNILCGRCEWYTVVERVAKSIDHSSKESSHSLLLLGGYDCVPVEPFNHASLKIAKIDIALTMREIAQRSAELASYAEDAVAIVGSACRLPGANNLDELWEMLEKRKSTCEEVRPDRVPISGSHRASLDPKVCYTPVIPNRAPSHVVQLTGIDAKFYCQLALSRKWFGNFIDNVDQFDNELFGLSHSEATWMDPQQRILLELAYEALDSYGHLGHRSYSREGGHNVACFIGGTLIEYNEHTTTHAPTAYSAIGTMQAFQCGRISHHFGWYGPSETIDTACSSSLVAISRAVAAIRAGDCSMAVAGGANVLGGVNYYLDLAKARFLSSTGQCKAFDVSADGYCRADGAGLVVLKRLKDAVASGDHILAVIPAAGTNQGGLSKSITLPDGKAQKQLYQRVVRSAGLQPRDISYIECHGTGTQAGDPNEIAGLRSVFGDADRDKTLFVGSVKGNVGHAEAAAGVTGLMKVLAMLSKSKIPPQASFKAINPNIGPLEPWGMAIPSGAVQPWDASGNVRRALVNSYGAAGSNASLIVCQSPVARPKSAWWLNRKETKEKDGLTNWPLLVTAATQASLAANCQALANMVRSEKPDVATLLWTLSEKRQRHRCRLVLPVNKDGDHEALAAALDQAASSPAQGPFDAKRMVLVFGGQSQRTVHLNSHLYDTTPQLRHYLAECDAILGELGYPPVVEDILNHDKVDQNVVLLQTATFVIQYSCAKTWEDAGLQIDAVVGHSFGELTALAFSGAVSLRDGLRIVAERASLMQTAWGEEKGKMLAVHAPLDSVKSVIDDVKGLEIACYNSTGSQVVVGTTLEIERAEAVVAEKLKGTLCQRVDVTHGFHSKFVDDLLPALEKLDDSLIFQKPRIHLELCTSEARGTEPRNGHIRRHARNPVFFEDAIARLEQSLGPSIWLEAGIDTPIIPMVKRAVKDAGTHAFFPINFKTARIPETVIRDTTISLWRAGVDTTYWPWIGATAFEAIKLPVYRFTRKSFWTKWVDHPVELQKRLDESLERQQLPAPITAASSSFKLISPSTPGSNRFIVNVNAGRFQQLVRGHAVCDQPMCPASMYMECVGMAVQIQESNRKRDFPGAGITLHFANLAFNHPLTLSYDLQVSVVLDLEVDSDRSWTFSIESTRTSQSNRPTIHVRGVVALMPSADMRQLKTLLGDRTAQTKAHPDAETILSRRVYTLFGTVVDYSHVLRGIESLTLQGNWAVGTIKSPKQLVARHETESSVLDLADAAIADNFVQVLGLAINTSEHVPQGSAFLVSSIDSFTFSQHCHLLNSTGSWTVTAHFNAEKNAKAISGDIYVTDNLGDVVASVLGVRFSLVQLSALRRVLDSAAGGQKTRSTPDTSEGFQSGAIHGDYLNEVANAPPSALPALTSKHAARQLEAQTSPYAVYAPPTQAPKEPKPESQKNNTETVQLVRDTVARYTGAVAGEMPGDSTMTELGIDSLAIVQFADEIENLFKKQFATDDLGNMTLQSLVDNCASSSMDSSVASSAGARATNVTAGIASSEESLNLVNVVEKVVVKKVDGVDVEVDVHMPKVPGSKPLGVEYHIVCITSYVIANLSSVAAILVHGGGHMALSRATIPSSTIVALSKSGFLSISVDYRLCPEVNLVQGPMADIIDVYRWVFEELPSFAGSNGLSVDPRNVVAVGWSSGGHLAMALDWMSQMAGLPAPKAVLTFYAPVAWASGSTHAQSPRNVLSEEVKCTLRKLIKRSTRKPYDIVLGHGFATDYYSLKWARGDGVRSQLICAALVPGHCLPLLMRGLPSRNENSDIDACLQPMQAEQLESICPLTHALRKSYNTPTFMIHGIEDDIVPLASAVELHDALCAAGVPCQLLRVQDAGHTFDYGLKYGDEAWQATIAPGFAFLESHAFS